MPGLEEQWAMADILIKKHEVREEWVATGETRHVPVATGETRHVPVAKRPKIGSPSSSGTAPNAEEDEVSSLSSGRDESPSPGWSVHVNDATAEAVATRLLCAKEAEERLAALCADEAEKRLKALSDSDGETQKRMQ